MKHDYTDEQKAYNGGLVDKFVEYTGSSYLGCNPKQVMGYYDGNTVTALWNYAQLEWTPLFGNALSII